MKLEFTKIEEIDYLMWPDNYQEILPSCTLLRRLKYLSLLNIRSSWIDWL